MNYQEQTFIPCITSLVLDDRPLPGLSHRQEPVPSWKAPFIELLGLLKIIDSSEPQPDLDGQRFCIQPFPDLSGLLRVFLSVHNSSSVQYDVDLDTIWFSESDHIKPAVLQLKEYAYKALRRIQHLRDCLISYNLITDPSCFLYVDMCTCPVCCSPLISCVDCDTEVACSSPSCPAYFLPERRICYAHNCMACDACLTRCQTIPSLISCPVCQGWCCREDVDWCHGLIMQPSQCTPEFAQLSHTSDWDSNMIQRYHAPKAAPCGRCFGHTLAQGWRTCNNAVAHKQRDGCPSQTPTMSRLDIQGAFCPDCVHFTPGHYSVCKSCWLCDTCAEIGNKTNVYPYLITCPRCRVGYCTAPQDKCPDSIGICQSCKRPRLCNDCQEEEEEVGEGQVATDQAATAVVFDIECHGCDFWTCTDCHLAGKTVTCLHCKEWFCVGCLADKEHNMIELCPLCNEHVCKYCRSDHFDCMGALLLGGGLPSPQFP